VLEDGETGLLVPPADAESLAQGILRVLEDEGLRRRLASRAREASARYDVRTCVDAMQQVYEEVAPRA
jgi:glycosyltransferase involved in cell wall biosynthesis